MEMSKTEDIKLLAAKRATAVYNQILKSGRVSPERVFIIEPKSMAAQKKDKAKDSRVDFPIKITAAFADPVKRDETKQNIFHGIPTSLPEELFR